MRSRAPALVAVVAFAVAVAVVAVIAGRGVDERLVKLPAGSSAGTASDEAAPASADAMAMSPRSGLLYPMPFEYKVEGTLPDLPSEAPGYRLGSAATADAVARLAASLGLVGDVQADASGWVVTDGGLQLRVERMAGLPWYVGMACPDTPVSSKDEVAATCAVAVDTPMPLPADGPATGGGSSGSSAGICPPEGCVDVAAVSAPGIDCTSAGACSAPTDCDGARVKCAVGMAVEPCEPSAACTVAAPTCPAGTKCTMAPVPPCAPDQRCEVPVPEPVERPARPADLPSEEEARSLARAAFDRLGVSTDGMVVDDGWDAWYARVEARVGGVDVLGMGSSLTIGPKGEITGGNGFLAVPERIGDYPLVGPDAALRRLTEGSGTGAGARDLVASAPAVDPAGTIEPAPAACGDPAVSCIAEPVPAPMVQVVTGAHLALLFHGDALVPAYVFELADGGSMPVVGVTDEWLDTESPGLSR